jgi:hypothetical protein
VALHNEVVRARACCATAIWANLFPEDFRELKEFAKRMGVKLCKEEPHDLEWRPIIRCVARKNAIMILVEQKRKESIFSWLPRDVARMIARKVFYDFELHDASCSLPIDNMVSDLQAFLLSFSPRNLARVVQNVRLQSFCRIDLRKEMFNFETKENSPNLCLYIAEFNRLVEMFSRSFLVGDGRGLKEIAELWCETARCLLEMKSLDGVFAVMGSLRSTAICRLNTVKLVYKTFSEVREFFESSGCVHKRARRLCEYEGFPYIGTHLADMTFLNEGAMDKRGTNLNMEKQLIEGTVVQFLCDRQRRLKNSIVADCDDICSRGQLLESFVLANLVKAPEKTDITLYDVSLRLQPRQLT